MTDEPDIHPERAKLNSLIEHCERRVTRAAERLQAAQTESDDAAGALAFAHERLAAWIEANPDPQMELI